MGFQLGSPAGIHQLSRLHSKGSTSGLQQGQLWRATDWSLPCLSPLHGPGDSTPSQGTGIAPDPWPGLIHP